MSVLSNAIVFLGVALEVCLLWRLLRHGLWRAFPFFSLYIVSVLARTLALFVFQKYFHALFASFYWNSEIVSMALRFLLVWEVFRHTFTKGSTLSRIISNRFALGALGLGILSVGAFWNFEAYSKSHSVYLALERSSGFAQAVMILGLLIIARYYGMQLGRNIWGIAIAFGAHLSIITVDVALIDLAPSLRPYWSDVSRAAFLMEMGLWIWAVWVYAPNPAIVPGGMAGEDPRLRQWEEGWNRTTSMARKVVQP